MANGAKTYFRDIGETFTTLWDGLRVTMYHFTRKKRLNATLQYPRERWPIPERHIGFEESQYNVIRSRLHVVIDDCIGCMQCERACPVSCIKIETVKIPKDMELAAIPGGTQTSTTSSGSAKRLLVARFDIDLAECMYCNLCVYPCPEDCIFMVGGPNGHRHPIDYEFSERDRNRLVYRFATATDEEVAQAAQLAGPGKAPTAEPKPGREISEPKIDLSALAVIEDRVVRSLAKKSATFAVRAGQSSAEVATAVKAALEAAGKLTPDIEAIVAQLAQAEIQRPGEEAAEAAPEPSKPAPGLEGIDLAVLNDISDRVARSLAKKAAVGAKRQGLSPAEVAAAIKAALEEAGKLDSDVEAILARLEGSS